ncbi:hypothetical protein L1987_50904 [Smallanthus sonchifolius]|uniref:Uncharacterized protein n=1 Tax=Smallanthus sonchifolius TaxID=185202 RepID=A0ACB9ENB3_9ASTR|nr:hypothetical protein L1987_50904 [Smallanthus sonchifolius]
MSGGFFRGTTADQDTRFSNKHAKLLKSHKFPPELENLVDMTKVKMDVMRPWIAHRVTELLGFEDEVLINFIYGLLEEKVVNGKEIQISLTGFMEKNTGKFMKELWTHLLSAQQNASGVPQQFLDAKEEETRKKQEDTDRITRELKRTKEKEGQEHEQERGKMDRDAVDVKAANSETHSRRRTKFSSKWSADDKGTDETNGSKGTARNSRSPRPADRSMSPPRVKRSRSVSKSFSNSRSHSRSRSLSASPKAIRRSVSAGRRSRSLSRRSSTPRRVGSRLQSPSPAPLRGRSPSPARRRLRSPSPAPARGRSPSPARRRLQSPARRGSRSPAWRRQSSLRRRSRSPIYRRSRTPIRRRSRSPVRRRSRSPVRRRSRTPVRRSRSPVRRRSRTPIRRRSPSPFQRRPRSPYRHRSPSPFQRRPRSPYRHRSQSSSSPYPAHSGSPPVRGRSPSPMRRQYQRAPSATHHRSPPPIRRRTTIPRRQRSPSPGSRSYSPSGRISVSPTRGTPPSYLKKGSPKRQQRSPVQSPRDGHRVVERNVPDRQAPRKETAERPISGKSLERDSKSRRISHNGEPVLSHSPYNSPSSSVSPPAAGRSPSQERSPIPPKRQRESMSVKDRLDRGEVDERNFSRVKEDRRENKDPVSDKHDKDKSFPEKLASHHSSGAQVQKNKSKNDDGRRNYPELSRGRARDLEKGYKADEMNQEAVNLPKVERNNESGLLGSGSEESDQKRKHKRSKRKDVTSDEDTSHDSRTEDRKEAKRRRKEEKKLRKEEKHKRREERRQRKDRRRSEKLKLKAGRNASPSSDFDKSHDSHDESALSDQKKLEIELREKALESLRAKKGVGH